MGNEQGHHSEHGNIYLKTTNPFYYAGENITGEVYLNLFKSYPAKSLFLKVKGKEFCRWDEQETEWINEPNGQRRAITKTIHRIGEKEFFSHKFPIWKWDNEIPPGQYCFPFSMILNNTLPGTFFEDEGHFQGRIRYKAKVEMIPEHHFEHIKKMKYHQDLIIREPIKNPQLYNVPQENVVNSKTWCCIDQGVSKIKCFFEKNTYCPGESANVITEIDNSLCSLPVRSLNMRLLMHIRLRDHNGREKFIEETINSVDVPGLGPRETAINEQRKLAGLLLTNQRRNRQIQPSTSGNIVRCEYFLSVKTILDGVTCCAADPEVRIPLTVFAPPLMNFNQVQAPLNWQPQMMPVYNCVFDPSYAYAKAGVGIPNQQPGYGGQPQPMYGGQPQPGYGGQPQPQPGYGGQPQIGNGGGQAQMVNVNMISPYQA